MFFLEFHNFNVCWINFFSRRQVSFLLKKEDNPQLYIWHQQKTVEETSVMIGGWFVCSETCNAMDAIYALQRQLELTDMECPGIPWVAVIKNCNRFVQSLNKRFGFEEMDKEHHLFNIAHQCFPSANPKDYKLIVRI